MRSADGQPGRRVLQITKRAPPRYTARVAVVLLSILLGLAVGALVLLFDGKQPLQVYAELVRGAFGDWYNLSETLVHFTPMLLCAVAVTWAAHMDLWNVGAEGQFFAGALGATWVALNLGKAVDSPWLVLPVMLLAGALCGGLWGVLAAIPRAYFQVNEIITTLMLTYVAVLFSDYLLTGPWKDSRGGVFPVTEKFAESAQLYTFPASRIHLGIVFAFLAVALLYVMLKYSRWGYEIRVTGSNPDAARYAGMHTARNILAVLFMAGAMAGIAGMTQVSGLYLHHEKTISLGYGTTGIVITWLARKDPLMLPVVAFLIAALTKGGYSIQPLGVPSSIVGTLQGLLLFAVLVGDFFLRYRLVWRRVQSAPGPVAPGTVMAKGERAG